MMERVASGWACALAQKLMVEGPLVDKDQLARVLMDVRRQALYEALVVCRLHAEKVQPRVLKSPDFEVTTANELDRCSAAVEALIYRDC